MFVKLKGNLDEMNIPSKTENTFRYMSDLRKYPVLRKEDFDELFRQYKLGSKDAFDKIVSSNLRYVVQYATRYAGSKIAFGDVICAGNEAIIEALKKYDPTKGKTFVSYSNYYISRKIRELYDGNFGVKLNSNTTRLIHSKRDKETDLSLNEIVDVFSMDAPIKNMRGDDYLFDIEDTSDDSFPDHKFKYMEIDIAMNKLNSRERRIVTLYFGIGGNPERNIPEIAKMFNTSSQNVSRILKGSLKKLKVQLEKIK